MARVTHVRALIDLIAGREPPREFHDSGWREVLEVGDRTLSTLLLRDATGTPEWFREEVAARSAKWLVRRERVIETYCSAAEALGRAGIEFVLIKGFTHEKDAQLDPAMRVQSDLDLLCSRDDVGQSRRVLCEAGFVSHKGSRLSDEHDLPLLRPHNWQWRGDYYDPEMPVPIEIHHSIWDPGRDRIEIPGLDELWLRREVLETSGMRVPVFHAQDRLTIALLHLLRHILRNNMRPSHAWEVHRMMRFFGKFEADPLESLTWRFCQVWFGGELTKEFAQTAEIEAWFEKSAWSPITNIVEPNKDVLALHMMLLSSWSDRAAVVKERLAPTRLPAPDEAEGSYAKHVAKRLGHHAMALARTLGRKAGSTRDSSTSQTSD